MVGKHALKEKKQTLLLLPTTEFEIPESLYTFISAIGTPFELHLSPNKIPHNLQLNDTHRQTQRVKRSAPLVKPSRKT